MLPVASVRQGLLASLAFLPEAVRLGPGVLGLPWSVGGKVVPVHAARTTGLALDASCLWFMSRVVVERNTR